jgi:hypothetical protein
MISSRTALCIGWLMVTLRANQNECQSKFRLRHLDHMPGATLGDVQYMQDCEAHSRRSRKDAVAIAPKTKYTG